MLPAIPNIYSMQAPAFPDVPRDVGNPIFYTEGKNPEYILFSEGKKKIIAIEFHWGSEEQESWLDTTEGEIQKRYALVGRVALIQCRKNSLLSTSEQAKLKNSTHGAIIQIRQQRFKIQARWNGFVFALAM